MPILDLQKRSRELGRIRLGEKSASGAPKKLDRFRFTGHSETLLTKIASLYGGEVRPWTPAGGTAQWEVISDTTRVPIMVPPQPVSQWYEYWTRAGIQHRCDGRTNVLTDDDCDHDDPKHIEALKKPTTRLNVVLRDVEGIGVWRVETHGWNAAIELPDVAEFLAAAGGYVNGWLSLEQRTSIEQTDQGPKTRHYLVPIIEVDVTPAQLMAGHGRVAAPALAGGPVTSAPALAAAGPDYVAMAADLTDPEAVRNVYRTAATAGHMTQGLSDHLQKRVADLTPTPPAVDSPVVEPTAAVEPDADGIVDAVLVEDTPAAPAAGQPDADVVWQQILKAGGERSMSLADIEDDVVGFLSISSAQASGEELAMYLAELQARPTEAGAA